MQEDYIAIDLGAESGRVILGSLNNNKINYREIHRFPTKGTYIFNTLRWNLLRFWEEIKNGLGKISQIDNLNLKGIGVDSWGVNLVYLTEDLEFSCQPFHYRDAITEIGDKKMHELFDMNRVFEITGLQEVQYNGLVHLAGIYEKYPEILKRTFKIIMIPDYFNYLLTGNLSTEYTNATTTQLFDTRQKCWSSEILSKFGLKQSVFPDLQLPGAKIGNLHPDINQETSLTNKNKKGNENVLVFTVASHDTASAVLGIPAEGDDWAYLSSGTWSLLGVEIPKPIINEKVKQYNFTNEGGVFNTIRLLKNIMGLWLLQRSKLIWDIEFEKETGKKLSYEQISNEAQDIEPKRFLINVDSPEFFNPQNMIKQIKDHCLSHNQPVPKTRGEIARCIYDSLAFRYSEVLKMIEDILGKKINSLYIVGGGSQDSLLNQLTANELKIPIYAGPVEATAIGNIMMQAYADGMVSDPREIREIIRNSFEVRKFFPQS